MTTHSSILPWKNTTDRGVCTPVHRITESDTTEGAHTTCNAKSEPYCKVCTLGDDNVSVQVH